MYNETIRDLICPGGGLPVREDPGKGVVIPGLSLHKVTHLNTSIKRALINLAKII